jgi:sugar diacid utilization regulator
MHFLDPGHGNSGASVIKDLIFGDISDLTAVVARVKLANLPLNGPFFLCRIVWPGYEYPFWKVLEQEFESKLPHIKTFPFSNEVLLLAQCEHVCQDVLSLDVFETIRTIMEAHDCKCMVSEPFVSLTKIKVAYTQTQYTQTFIEKSLREDGKGVIQMPGKNPLSAQSIYSYQNIFIRSIFKIFAEDHSAIANNSVYVTAVRALVDYDRAHNRDLAKILYCYLCNERNASKTAKSVHMSRNNVLYHIAKAAEILKMPLDDHQVRFGLLTAYYLLGI